MITAHRGLLKVKVIGHVCVLCECLLWLRLVVMAVDWVAVVALSVAA